MNIEIGNKPIDFVFQGDELIHPNYVAKDNLVLHYDFSGRTNLDVKKGIAEDLSGNGNDGILENFAYESGSGYDSNSYLEFDNVDDFITIPELNLDVNNFTVAVDGEVLSYRGDNVAKINENGLEIGGRNLLPAFTSDKWEKSISVEPYRFTPRTNLDDTISTELEFIRGYEYTLTFNTEYMRFYVYTFDEFGELRILKVGGYSEVYTFTVPNDGGNEYILFNTTSTNIGLERSTWNPKLEKGNKATDWSPAPEDFQTTRITSFFSNKIKTLMYWNRALTDTELQEVYNVQKYRI